MSVVAWEPAKLYENGDLVEYEGVEYRIVCPEHGKGCPGGGVRTGFLPPPLVIEDARVSEHAARRQVYQAVEA